MGIPIVAGRGFNAQDTRTSTHVAVISEKLAREAFPGVNPIGKRFITRSEPKAGKPGELLQIVGVCADTSYSNLREDPPGVFYQPFLAGGEPGRRHDI